MSQLWQMWSTGTAAGQSIMGWISVNLALILWLNFYHTFTPDQKFAIWGTRLGLLLNGSVIASVWWFSA